MGDLAEDMAEALRVIDAYVDACVTVESESWRIYEGLGEQGDVDDALGDKTTTREEMIETLRALIDPRACP